MRIEDIIIDTTREVLNVEDKLRIKMEEQQPNKAWQEGAVTV